MSVNRSSVAFVARTGGARQSVRAAQRSFAKTFGKIKGATNTGLRDAAVEIYKESQILVPVSPPGTKHQWGGSGTLKESGFVAAQTTSRKAVTGRVGTIRGESYVVGYGGEKAPYAVFVHEILRYRHEAPTQAKFLSHAFINVASRLPRIVARAIRRERRL